MWIEDEPGGGGRCGHCAAAHADCALHTLWREREGVDEKSCGRGNARHSGMYAKIPWLDLC